MPQRNQRIWAMLCYLGALRVPIIALAVPEWAFTAPSGLLIAGAAWLYGRRRDLPYLTHHGREGTKWALQANLLLAAMALLSRLVYLGWLQTGWSGMHAVWHYTAIGFQWTGGLVSVLTMITMFRAVRGETHDPLTASRPS